METLKIKKTRTVEDGEETITLPAYFKEPSIGLFFKIVSKTEMFQICIQKHHSELFIYHNEDIISDHAKKQPSNIDDWKQAVEKLREAVVRFAEEELSDLPVEAKTQMVKCPDCGGDGKETCHNPDHGFISGMAGFEINRLGCPVCGNDPEYKIAKGGNCDTCKGKGIVSEDIAESWSIDNNYNEKFEYVVDPYQAIEKKLNQVI